MSFLSIIVPVHLGQPVGSVDPLLVHVGHGRAGDLKDVVAVGDSHRLPTDETKIAKCFTWFWITIAIAGTFILVLVLGVIIDIILIIKISLVILTGALNTISWRGFICHDILDSSKFRDFAPFSERHLRWLIDWQ